MADNNRTGKREYEISFQPKHSYQKLLSKAYGLITPVSIESVPSQKPEESVSPSTKSIHQEEQIG